MTYQLNNKINDKSIEFKYFYQQLSQFDEYQLQVSLVNEKYTTPIE